jgi:hypothetical protein
LSIEMDFVTVSNLKAQLHAARGMGLRSLIAASVCACALVAAPARASAASEAHRAYAAGLTAYVHGYPPLISAASQARFPVNTMVGVAATSSVDNRLVVLPNVDTAYTVARLDLQNGPLIVHVPAMRGRYYTLQLMDAYTTVAGYIGTRVTGNGAGEYAIAGPGWKGPVAGMKTLHSPTPDALLLGRTLVEPSDTSATLHKILGSFSMTPRSTLASGGQPQGSVVINQTPMSRMPALPRGLAFLEAFDRLLAQDPPSAAERRSLAPLRRFGIGPGLRASSTRLPAAVQRALIRGVDAGPSHLEGLVEQLRRSSGSRHAGWVLTGPRTGDAGTDWDLRAVVAKLELWANTPDEAIYPIAATDVQGRALSGKHRYVLRFAARPPAKAFWSVTMYDSGLHLYPNSLQRYALGDRSRGLRPARDGSITIYLQHRPPRRDLGAWLPAPAGRFTIGLRLYVPRASALSSSWSPPGIRCLDCGR